MKKCLTFLLCVSMVCSSSVLISSDDINQYKEDTEALWNKSSGSEDGAYAAISTSMLGWGLVLAAGIAILASVLHQSTAD